MKRKPVRSICALLAAVAVGILTSIPPSLAETIPFGPGLAAQGWKTLTFRSLEPVVYGGEGSRLTIRADKAASLIWREVDEGSVRAKTARWRWRVEQGPPPTNLGVKGKDDRAIALYFAFARDEATAARARGAQSLTSAMWWSSGAALVYVWGGDAARGTMLDSPYLGSSGKLIIRQPASRNGQAFVPETADLVADFRRAFGRDPGPLVGIAISSDSDDSGSATRAELDGLTLD